jgi:hypothetical protein
MARSLLGGSKRFRVFLLPLLSLLAAGCGAASHKPSPSASQVAVGSREELFVGLPVVSDSALSVLEALGWGDGRFQGELRKEIIFQFERKKVPIAKDSAGAEAWLDVRLVAYDSGADSRYLGDALLRTVKGERRIGFGKSGTSDGSAQRSDPTVDHILHIAETLAAEARKRPAAGPTPEPRVQMWIMF